MLRSPFNARALTAFNAQMASITAMIARGIQPPIELYELALSELQNIYEPVPEGHRMTTIDSMLLMTIEEQRRFLVSTIERLKQNIMNSERPVIQDFRLIDGPDDAVPPTLH